MILHHYDASPFSEKVRLMFGYCAMDWQSVVSPAMPPRPNIDPLTGGYRRMPVAQLGADIFCDTRIICDEIATLAANPRLSLDNQKSALSDFVEYTEFQVFFALAAQISVAESMAMLLRNLSPWDAMKFIKDRAVMFRTASARMPSRLEAKRIANDFYQDCEQRLNQHDYLFGDEPGICDFAAYHPLWFRFCSRGSFPAGVGPKLDHWFNTMTALGHGVRTEIAAQDAFDQARHNLPRSLEGVDTSADKIGDWVVVRPEDYAQTAVEGVLVGCTESRWILCRETSQFGMLHVHFPRRGYQLV